MSSTTQTRLWIQLLGPVRAWRGDEEIDLGSGRRRAVFAILAAEANKVVSRAELVDGIWGDAPPTKAIGILHTYISALRKELEPQRAKRSSTSILTTIESSYSLQLRPDQLDEQRFEQLLSLAQRHWENGRIEAAVEALDAAVGLSRGEALSGLTTPFVALYRARLSEMMVTAMERRAALRLILGRDVEAIGDLTTMVANFPLRESARGLLMAALYKAHRRPEALDLFADTHNVLVARLGIDPGPALQRIHHKIVHAEPLSAEDIGSTTWMPRQASSVSSLTALNQARPTVPAIFVGRRQELSQLRTLLDQLDDGRGACVWIEGEAGIGKTALLAKAFGGNASDNAVIWVKGDKLERASATVAQTSAFGQLLTATEQACTQTPIVFIVEDIHQGGDADLLIWNRLTRITRHLPLLLVATCRTSPREAEIIRVRNSVRVADCHLLLLNPLAADDVAELAAGRLAESFTPMIVPPLQIAAGNPGHIRDLLDAFAASGAVHAGASHAEIQRTMAAVASAIAFRRLGSLDPDTQDVLRWAAILGVEFYPGDLTKIMRVSPAALASVVKEATTAGVLLENQDSLTFRDETVRQKLLDNDGSERRAVRHRDAAEALADAGAPVERVAAQLLLALPPVDPWALRWILANIDSVGQRTPDVAAELLNVALESLPVDAAEREVLMVRRIRLMCEFDQDPRDEVAALLTATKNIEHAGEMRWIHACLDYQRGAVEQALAELHEAERIENIPPRWKARYQSLRARFERETFDDITVAMNTATTALEQAMIAADPLAISEALGELWYSETVRGDYAAALRYVDRALSTTAGESDLTEQRVTLLDKRAGTLQSLDRLFEASATLAQMRSLSQHNRHLIARHHVVTAVHYYWLGRWDEAVAELGLVSEDLLVNVGGHRLQTVLLYHGVAALIAVRRADITTAESHLRAAAVYPIDNRSAWEASDYLLAARAIVDGIQTGAAAALPNLDPMLDVGYGRPMPRYQWLPPVIRLSRLAQDQQRARAALEVCRIEADREVGTGRAHAALQWCRGLIDRDPDGLLALARHFSDIGRPVETADVLVDAASVLAEQSKTSMALMTFRDALTIYTEFGASFDIKRTGDAMVTNGVDRESDTARQWLVAGWHSLSEVERRITKLVAVCKTNPEIAAELTLPRRDVQWHISHIMEKLGVNSRSRSALEARVAGLTAALHNERKG